MCEGVAVNEMHSSDRQPLYAKVKDHIVENINNGTWPTGTRVPSENEIVEQFSVSRMTANRALKELTHEGYVARIPGIGTFVKDPPQHASLIEIRNIADEISGRGHEYSNRILDVGVKTATPLLADEFEINNNASLFHIQIIHRENNIPVQLEDRYVNPLVVPQFLKQDFTTTTPTAYLIANAAVDELEHTVEAVMPPPEVQAILETDTGEPCLTLNRRSWAGRHVVTVARLTYPASRYALHSRYRPGRN